MPISLFLSVVEFASKLNITPQYCDIIMDKSIVFGRLPFSQYVALSLHFWSPQGHVQSDIRPGLVILSRSCGRSPQLTFFLIGLGIAVPVPSINKALFALLS